MLEKYPDVLNVKEVCTILRISRKTVYALRLQKIFENRYKYMSELKKMGAKITIEGKTAVIKGTKRLPPYSDVVGNQERKAAIMSWKLPPEENAKGVRTIGEGNNKKVVETEIDDNDEKEER